MEEVNLDIRIGQKGEIALGFVFTDGTFHPFLVFSDVDRYESFLNWQREALPFLKTVIPPSFTKAFEVENI